MHLDVGLRRLKSCMVTNVIQVDASKCRSWRPRGFKSCFCGRPPGGNVVSNPAGACMSLSCECCVLLGGRLCVGLITRPEESYQV